MNDNLTWAEAKLKKCPCCGAPVEFKTREYTGYSKHVHIHCPACGLRSRYECVDDLNEIRRLVYDWNRRVDQSNENYLVWRKIKYIALWPVFMIPTLAMAMMATIGKVCDIASDNLLKAYREFVR